jgi:hypothetical protein
MKTSISVQRQTKNHVTSKAFFILPPSWLTEAERASGLIRAAASPVFQWFSNDQRD